MAQSTVDQRGDALLFLEGVILRGAPLSGGNWAARDSQSFIDNGHFLARTVLDVRRRRLMVFGGGRPEETSNDVWVLSLDTPSQWRKLESSGARPLARSGASIAFDEVHDRLLIYGGYAPGQDFTDTWELRLDGAPTWGALSLASSYGGYDAPMIFDPAKNRLLAWTYVPEAPPARMIEFRFDDALGWRLVKTTGMPPTNYWRQNSALDPGRERWLIFGAGSYGPNDTRLWTYDMKLDAWSADGLIDGHRWELVGGMFDPVEDRLVLFGGRYGGNPSTAVYPTELFSYPMSTTDVAQPIATKGIGPSPREFPSMVYDAVQDGLLLAGGGGPVYSTTLMTDFWTLDRGQRSVRRLAALVTDTTIRLNWTIPSHRGRALSLSRRTGDSVWSELMTRAVDSDGLLSFELTDIDPGTSYGFRLVDPGSASVQPLDQYWVRSTGATPVPPAPQGGALVRVLENPARGSIRFVVHLDQATQVGYALFDLQGRSVQQWDRGMLPPGDHLLGADATRGATTGVLFLRVRAGDATVTRRVVSFP